MFVNISQFFELCFNFFNVRFQKNRNETIWFGLANHKSMLQVDGTILSNLYSCTEIVVVGETRTARFEKRPWESVSEHQHRRFAHYSNAYHEYGHVCKLLYLNGFQLIQSVLQNSLNIIFFNFFRMKRCCTENNAFKNTFKKPRQHLQERTSITFVSHQMVY